jgi:hypothetical protein
MKLKHVFLAVAAILFIAGAAQADGDADTVIQISGGFSPFPGETFTVSYEAD